MHDDDVESAAQRCPDCCVCLQPAISHGTRYLVCPDCGLVRVLPFAAWTAAFDRRVDARSRSWSEEAQPYSLSGGSAAQHR